MLYGGGSVVAIGELQRLNLVEVGTACGDSSVEDFAYEGDEVLTGSYEVGLTLHGNHCGEAINLLNQYATI